MTDRQLVEVFILSPGIFDSSMLTCANSCEYESAFVYGRVSDEAMMVLEQATAGGVTLTVRIGWVSDYLRLESFQSSV